jgi:hypothetical protein
MLTVSSMSMKLWEPHWLRVMAYIIECVGELGEIVGLVDCPVICNNVATVSLFILCPEEHVGCGIR